MPYPVSTNGICKVLTTSRNTLLIRMSGQGKEGKSAVRGGEEANWGQCQVVLQGSLCLS